VQHEAAGLEHGGALGERERLTHVLLDEHDRHAVGVDRAHGVEDALDQHGGQAERGLVQHQHARLGHQRAADRAHLLLTAGE